MERNILFSLTILIAGQTTGQFVEEILQNHEEFQLHPELETLVTDIILTTPDLNCLAVVCDDTYQDVFGRYFFDKIKGVPFFKVFVVENEDLSSPNYATLSTIKEIRKNGCRLYVILMSNGDKVSKFLRFGDKNRELDTRANFILLNDNRLFQPELHYLWKKLINVIFLRRFTPHVGAAPWYELSTVPFPAPVRGVLIPRRLDTWRRGVFYSNFELFRDKTSDLKRQALKVITFQHVPAAFKMPAPSISKEVTLEGTQPIGYTGLEIELLDTLSTIMNFESDVYDVPGYEKWGLRQINGSFSGLIGEVVSGRADIALGNLYYTPYHLNLMDLTIPYTTQCLTFLTPESQTDNSWQTLILPFTGYLWAGVFISLILGALVFLAFAKFHRIIEDKLFILNQSQMNNNTSNLMKNGNSLNRLRNESVLGLFQFEQPTNSFLYTYSMLLLVSLPKLPAGWSLRIFTGWWWIYCILVVVAYRASMISILANPAPRQVILENILKILGPKMLFKFYGMVDFGPLTMKIYWYIGQHSIIIESNFPREINLGVFGNQGNCLEVTGVTIDTLEQLAESEIAAGGWGEEIKTFFQTSLDAAGKKIGSKFESIYDTDEAIERVSKGEFAFYENIHFLRHASIHRQIVSMEDRIRDSQDTENVTEAKEERNLHIMKDCVINMPISLGLQKNSPLKPRVDRFLRMIIEAGLVKKWLNDAMADVLIADLDSNTESVKALMNLKKLFGAFVALGIGYAISIIGLLGEIINWEVNVVRNPYYDKYSNSIIKVKK